MNTGAIVTANGVRLTVRTGVRLSDVLRAHGLLSEMPCGGAGRCGKCRVAARGALSPVSAAERALLTGEQLAGGLRLACCCTVQGDCTVQLPKTTQSSICADGRMPAFARDPLFAAYGAAIDIGTTTLAAQLYGPQGILARAVLQNPQVRYGADVLSRIGASLHGGAQELAACIRGALASLLRALARDAGIGAADIDAVTIAGNTAMLYLLTAREPASLSRAPFEADHLFGDIARGASLGLPCARAAVYLLPCMSAFVGADITAAVLASGMCSGGGTQLLADIGTNGEMALWHGGKLTCCSTAAGPAFEGAGLSMGMAGRRGAVDRVDVVNGALRAHVIGDTAPEGICGSGVIDAAACLLQTGQLDETGALKEGEAVIAPPVRLTQGDIRQVQLAKSAVCAGIVTLLRSAGVGFEEVGAFYIAGGFGSFLRIDSAAAIGLVPSQLAGKARVLGNAALTGAAMVLLRREHWQCCFAICGQAHTLQLSESPAFMEQYVESMMF